MAKARWREIAESWRDNIEAGAVKLGASLPTEEQLALQWNVSRMTVHRAMQELERLGLVTRRQGSGTLVSSRHARASGPIALLMHNTLNLLEIENLRGISAGLGSEQQILFCDTRNDAKIEARQLRRARKNAAGIICVPTCAPENTSLLQEIAGSGFPLVCIDRIPNGVTADAVMTNNTQSSLSALRTLTKRGHQCFAHFTHDLPEVSSVRERQQAFFDIAHEIGQSEPERYIRRFPRRMDDFAALQQLMEDALFALLHDAHPPTALFCMNDWLLAPLLEACKYLQVRVPQDLEIVSFNDAPLLLIPLMNARITQIVQQPNRIGYLAAERLVQRLRGETPAPEIIRVAAEIWEPNSQRPFDRAERE